MAEETNRQQVNVPEGETDRDAALDEPVPVPLDPGGAHAKAYSADPVVGPAVADEEPVPLVPSPDGPSAVRVPERDNHVEPTGRKEPGPYSPNDRLLGADR